MIQALPQEKRDQLQKLRVETQEKLSGLAKQAEAQSMTLGELMRAYPLDVAAAKKAEAALAKSRGQMFEVRVESIAKQQQIIGKEAWTKMQAERQPRQMDRPMPPQGSGPRMPPPGAPKQ